MATVKQFEDLLMWQKARLLAKEIYQAFRDCKDYGFRDQIQRAVISIMSNIAEGFESGTRLEFLNYLYIAKASAGEVRAQLYAAYDIGYLNFETFKYLNSLVLECSRLTASFIKSLKQSNVAGHQYKREKTKSQINPVRSLNQFNVIQNIVRRSRFALCGNEQECVLLDF